MKEFQATLTNIPQWNSLIIDNEYDRIMKGSHCDWLGNLILAVFKATTKELLIFKNCDNDVDVVVPSAKIFIHSCYIEIARVLWRKPQLMYHKYTGTKASMNEDELDQSVKNSIDITLNKYLPFETIISKFVNTTDTTASNDSEKASGNNTPTNTPRNSEKSNKDDNMEAYTDDPHDTEASTDDTEASTEEIQNDSIEEIQNDSIKVDDADNDANKNDSLEDDEETNTQQPNDIKIIDTDKNKSYNNSQQARITYQPKEEPNNTSNEIIKEIILGEDESENESENDEVGEDIMIKDAHEDFEQEVIQNTIHESLVNDSLIPNHHDTFFDTSSDVPIILTTPPLPLEPIGLEIPPQVPHQVPPQVPPQVPHQAPPQVPHQAPPQVPHQAPLEAHSVPYEEHHQPQQPHSTNIGGDNHWINDEVNRSIKEINLKTKEHKNKEKIKKHLGLDIDSNTLKQNYKQIRTQLLLENSKRWG